MRVTPLFRLSRQLCAAVRAGLAGDSVTVPEAGRPLWQAFLRLSATRSYHMAGPNPISHAEIDAFARLMCLPLEPRHVAILAAMDAAWLDAVQTRSRRAPEGVRTLPPMSKQPISAALFDVAVS
jgi:hypothetical protein